MLLLKLLQLNSWKEVKRGMTNWKGQNIIWPTFPSKKLANYAGDLSCVGGGVKERGTSNMKFVNLHLVVIFWWTVLRVERRHGPLPPWPIWLRAYIWRDNVTLQYSSIQTASCLLTSCCASFGYFSLRKEQLLLKSRKKTTAKKFPVRPKLSLPKRATPTLGGHSFLP